KASASCSHSRALASPEPGKILPRMVSHSELRKLFYSADAVCFDVDSTVIREEGFYVRSSCQLFHVSQLEEPCPAPSQQP
uniref:Phosphoserine phosphatase n=1 Tax=Theropithecus gelada TaxID=9565 RepID=A0A8D2JWU2_THEGE